MTATAAVAWTAVLLTCLSARAVAQTPAASNQVRLASDTNMSGADMSDMQPVMDNAIFTHALLEQLEGRWNGRNQQFRYDGQIWSGTDTNKLWFKSEGMVTNKGKFTDAQHDLLFDHAISPYFDLQAGVRVDLDAATTRTWAALGIEGLSLYFFDVEATAYASDHGRVAARLKASYDLLITQRLILQPEVEVNFYSKSDSGRGSGSGLSDIDAGLRLRYEITRKVAPYIGVSYAGRFFQSAEFARQEREPHNDVRFVFGVRTWF